MLSCSKAGFPTLSHTHSNLFVLPKSDIVRKRHQVGQQGWQGAGMLIYICSILCSTDLLKRGQKLLIIRKLREVCRSKATKQLSFRRIQNWCGPYYKTAWLVGASCGWGIVLSGQFSQPQFISLVLLCRGNEEQQ